MNTFLVNQLLDFDKAPEIRFAVLYGRDKGISTSFLGNLLVSEDAIEERIVAVEAIRKRMNADTRGEDSYEQISLRRAEEKVSHLRRYAKFPLKKLEEFSRSFDRCSTLLVSRRSPDFAARYIHGESFDATVSEIRVLYSALLTDQTVDQGLYAYGRSLVPLQELVDELDVMALLGVKDFAQTS